MNRTLKETKLTGTVSQDVQPYELRHRKVAKTAAEEGFVLLKNEHHILPVAKALSWLSTVQAPQIQSKAEPVPVTSMNGKW